MLKPKKIGILVTASALSIGLFMTPASATSVLGQSEKVLNQVAVAQSTFSKADLIKKFRSLFPDFASVKESEFTMHSGTYYPEDGITRYNLSFTQTIDGKRYHGNVSFYGSNLEIEHFSYSPPTTADSLFPAKYSKEEAQQKAVDFVKKFFKNENYQLNANQYNYYPARILTEPIYYSFSFSKTENGIPLSDQQVDVSILGNGDVTSLSRYPAKVEKHTFDSVKNVKDKNSILKGWKDNLSVELQYQIDYDYRTGNPKVNLVYQPNPYLVGNHALDGKWYDGQEFLTTYPKGKKLEKIVEKALPAKQKGITVEQAKKIAEKMLKPNSDKVTFHIQSVDEIENYNGRNVISISYSYDTKNGRYGYGGSFEIDKQTGELVSYSSGLPHILQELGEKVEVKKPITEKEALTKAMAYLKEWTPSILHDFAKPLEDPSHDEQSGTYHFNFPRVVNGIKVSGDQISVSISADGKLSSLYTSHQQISDWPSIKGVIPAKEAKEIYMKSLDVKLVYMKQYNSEKKHYNLLYTPTYNNNSYNTLNALTGKWISYNGDESITQVTHSWAEEELNYLISTGALEVKDAKKFNGDAAVSRGEALKMMINSLTYIYGGYYGEENPNQAFQNINSKHPLYQVVQRAVETGIISADSKTFDVDGKVTREELAAWSIKAMGLDAAAKNSKIYKNDFTDAANIKPEYAGYVALADSLGLLSAENGKFNPTKEVTYAEIAVSTIKLAHAISQKNKGINMYY